MHVPSPHDPYDLLFLTVFVIIAVVGTFTYNVGLFAVGIFGTIVIALLEIHDLWTICQRKNQRRK